MKSTVESSVNLSMKKSDPSTIQAMFGEIAPRYDQANSWLSFNLHKLWNKKLVKSANLTNPKKLLDLCAGTGEISYLWLKDHELRKEVIMLDFCEGMLQVAKERSHEARNHKLKFIQGDAQLIPLKNNSVDAVTVAYGIRNVKESLKCFKEVFRVLKPGGTFGILELTEPNNVIVKAGHKFYLENFLPTIGGWITRKPEAYKYLSSSIQAFVKPQVLVNEMESCGFSEVKMQPLTFGIAHLITAKKQNS